MQEIYKLAGILNLFNVLPDFVYPVFEKNNQYYFMIGDEDTLNTEGYIPVIGDDVIKRIAKISDLKTNEIRQVDFTKESKPFFCFQLSETEVFFGFFEEIKDFLQNFETQDEILKEEIADFLTYGSKQ